MSAATAPDAAEEATAPDVEESPALPSDAAAWRALLAAVSPRDLLKAITRDANANARIFAGFRPGPETLRRAIVTQRIIEAVDKDPKFAREVAALPPVASPVESVRPGAVLPPPVPAPPEPHPDDHKLRDKLKEQRGALREKDARISALEDDLSRAVRERDAGQRDVETERGARRAAEAEAERQRRRKDRDAVRETEAAAERSRLRERTVRRETIVTAPAAPSGGHLIEEGLQRLLTRGRYALVAEVCREAVAAERAAGVTNGERGRLHALFAAALYGEGNPEGGETEDRRAVECLLDAGDLTGATGALGRILVHAPNLRSQTLTPVFKRLYGLAEKMGQVGAVRDILTHVRIASPEANRRLHAALQGGAAPDGAPTGLLKSFSATTATVGPDESIALPTAQPDSSAVTARRIVTAVDASDGVFIARVRSGIRALQARGDAERALAASLLEAVARLRPLAVQPLMQPANHPVIVDASNVARSNPDPLSLSQVPRVAHLLKIRDYLLRRGFFPVVLIADANLRFHVDDREAYQDLITRAIVRETPPGTSADEELISEARHRAAPLVTNDRLSEWGSAAAGIERLGFALLPDGAALTTF
jgi:hypothetical protein